MGRSVTKLALAAWVLVLALLGAEVGLAVFRPWDHHVALSLSATDRVFSIRLAGGGGPALVHVVRITTTANYYDFIFLLDEPSSSVVAQLLDSATVQ